MSTIQVIAIGAAAIIVVLLIVALLVTRRRVAAGQPGEELSSDTESFLGEIPTDTLAGLGLAEQPDEAMEVSADGSRDEEVLLAGQGDVGGGEADVTGETDERPSEEARAADDVSPEEVPRTEQDAPVDAPPDEASADAFPSDLAALEDAAAAVGRSADGARSTRMIPLSDVIVTTSSKLVDLQDPDVRRMLTDLVRLEVDQAIEYRRRGQTVDAIMQLAEAEKISAALGLSESAERVHRMVEELKRRS